MKWQNLSLQGHLSLGFTLLPLLFPFLRRLAYILLLFYLFFTSILNFWLLQPQKGMIKCILFFIYRFWVSIGLIELTINAGRSSRSTGPCTSSRPPTHATAPTTTHHSLHLHHYEIRLHNIVAIILPYKKWSTFGTSPVRII